MTLRFPIILIIGGLLFACSTANKSRDEAATPDKTGEPPVTADHSDVRSSPENAAKPASLEMVVAAERLQVSSDSAVGIAAKAFAGDQLRARPMRSEVLDRENYQHFDDNPDGGSF